MKDLSIKIAPNGNEHLVESAMKNYLHNPNQKTLIMLLYSAIAYELYVNNLNEIELNIKKITPNASYINNTINLNKKTLKYAKKVEYMPNYIKWIFHEIGHIKADKNNGMIFKTKTNPSKYLHNIINQDFYDIIYAETKDMEIAGMGAMWYYQKNKGETYARKNGYKLSVEFFEKFAPEFISNIQTPEQETKQLIKNIYSAYPDLRYNESVIDKFVIQFQNNCLQKGLNNLTEQELHLLDVSLKENLTTPIKDQLINQLIDCDNFKIVEKILENPYIKLTKKQLSSLSDKYGNKVVDDLIFKENIIDNELDK